MGPPKIAETESSANTFMIVSASSSPTDSTRRLSGLFRTSIGTVSVTTMPPSSAFLNRSSALPQKRPWVAKTQTSFAPCSFSTLTFSSRVPPVMITSSPTIATLSRTRPVMSVTATSSCDGRVLCMTAKSASIISAKRAAILARPASGETETISLPVSPRSRK